MPFQLSLQRCIFRELRIISIRGVPPENPLNKISPGLTFIEYFKAILEADYIGIFPYLYDLLFR